MSDVGAFRMGHRDTHPELHVHEHRSRNRQDVERVRDREIGQDRHSAPMELLKREGAKFLDAKEHPECHGQLHEWHQQHGQHAHAGLFVHTALLQRNALHAKLVPRLVRPVELLLEFEQPRLVRCERGRVAQLLDRERYQQQPREQRARDDRVEPREPRRDVHELKQPRG